MAQHEERGPARPNSLYTQLALHTIGNALAILLGLMLYYLWEVLRDFRDPMLYALLCSIALRGPKDWLVKRFDVRLSQDRSVVWALLSVLALPLTALKETYEDARDLLLKWRQLVVEYQQELAKRQAFRRSISAPEATPASPRSPRLSAPASPRSPLSRHATSDGLTAKPPPAYAYASAPATPTHTLPVLLSVYAKAGVKALKARRSSKKKRRRAARRPPVPSAVLFRWLFRAILVWTVYEWVWAAWSATVQLVVLATTLVLAVGAVPLLYLSAHWYLGATVFSPLKTPPGGLGMQGRTPHTPVTDRSGVTPLRRPRFTPASGSAAAPATRLPFPGNGRASRSASPEQRSLSTTLNGPGHSGGGGTADLAGKAFAGVDPPCTPARSRGRGAAWWVPACRALGGAAATCHSLICSLDGGLRTLLRRNLHALVSLLLIAGLLLGSTGLAAFLTVRVAQEGRGTLLAVRDVFPAAWASVAATTPMLAEAVPPVLEAVTAVTTATAATAGDPAGDRNAGSSVDLGSTGSDQGGSEGQGEGLQAGDCSGGGCGVTPWPEGLGEELCSSSEPAAPPGTCPPPELVPGAPPMRRASLPPWLSAYQHEAQGLIQRSLPGVATWVEGQVGRFMARHNLTAAAKDLRLLYETVQGPRRCSAKERGQLLVAVARAELQLREAAQQEKEASSRADRLKLRLTSALQQLARLRSGVPLPDTPHEQPAAGPQEGAAQQAAPAGRGSTGEAGTEGQSATAAAGTGAGAGPARAAMPKGRTVAEREAPAKHDTAQATGPAGAQGSSGGSSPSSSSRLVAVQQEVVAADGELGLAKAAHSAALEAVAAAQREATAAEGRLQLCRSEEGQEGEGGQAGQHVPLPGLVGDVGRRLQTAYARLWHRQLREGWAEMRGAAALCIDALRNATSYQAQGAGAAGGRHQQQQQQLPHGRAQGGSNNPSSSSSLPSAYAAPSHVADLGSLQRLLLAAADPLIITGRALAGVFALSVGSTTTAALMGGLGVLRLGLGLAKFGMQLTLFLALLFYLLAATREPLAHAVGVLPLSEGGKQRAASAFTKALGGVFVSSVKLVAFHSAFTWLTFRMFALPLTYTATVLCAACALLPFIPTYVVALPPCIALAAQGRLVSGLVFLGLHFLAYYLGDTLILEDIPGGHPYLMSLGILGGIWTFDNPLQGCLLGPILLSLLSVFYQLHSEFMSSSGQGDQGPAASSSPARGMWSAGGRKLQGPRVHINNPPHIVTPSLGLSPESLAAPLAAAGAAAAASTPFAAAAGEAGRVPAPAAITSPAPRAGKAASLAIGPGGGDTAGGFGGSLPDSSTRQHLHQQRQPDLQDAAGQDGSRQHSPAEGGSQQSISLSFGGLQRRGSTSSSSRHSAQDSVNQGSASGRSQRHREVQQEGGDAEGESAGSRPRPTPRQVPQKQQRTQQQRFAMLADLEDFSFGRNDMGGL
ncbi:hypothetical protein N2152v2_006186 [Parachlorella kessleri]